MQKLLTGRAKEKIFLWYNRITPVTSQVLFLVESLTVSQNDNFLRPVLIQKGADLPLVMIFAGVIGGLVALASWVFL